MAEAAPGEDFSKYLDAPLLERLTKPLEGQSALITGATRFNGIGFAIAERFALEGASIVIVGTQNSKDVASFVVYRLKRYGVPVKNLVADIRSEEQVSETMEEAYEFCDGNVNILVNNAGTNVNAALTDATRADWLNVVETKAWGAFLNTREWFRVRNESEANIRGGKVINIGSVVGIHGNFGQALYAMANGAIISLTKSLALDLGRRGININCIAPGFVEGTGMTEEEADKIEAVKPVIPLKGIKDRTNGVILSAQDVAETALYLASSAGDKVSGQILTIDGAMGANYTALEGLYMAGNRKIPRHALAIAESLTREEVEMIRELRANKSTGAENG